MILHGVVMVTYCHHYHNHHHYHLLHYYHHHHHHRHHHHHHHHHHHAIIRPSCHAILHSLPPSPPPKVCSKLSFPSFPNSNSSSNSNTHFPPALITTPLTWQPNSSSQSRIAPPATLFFSHPPSCCNQLPPLL